MEELTKNGVKERKPDPVSGFVRGTPVWTDRGLVPIETIRVGDRVLSRPENDSTAPTAYKRVSHTFVTENAEVMSVIVGRTVEVDDIPCFEAVHALVVTPEHPVWATSRSGEDWAWRPAGHLWGGGQNVGLQDGSIAAVSDSGRLYQWHDSKTYEPVPGVAWTSDKRIVGVKVDFRGEGAPVFGDGGADGYSPYYSFVDANEAGYDNDMFLTTVYKFTVEDNPTYFVGEMGVWVGCAKPG